jgi:ABC-type nitrate/sulfonate/bicarbonate transport system substrate-binding protein
MRLGLKWLTAVIVAILSGQAAYAADKVRVGTPEGTSFAFAVIDVGIGADVFKKYDLEVEKINFAGGSKLQQGMTADAIDVSVAGNTELAFVGKGLPEIAVAVTAGAPVDMSVIVRMDNDIMKLSDLKGKTIGVTSETSLTSYLALALSRRQGWGNEGVKRAYIGGTSSQVAGLLVKNVDAIVAPVESGLILEAEGKAHSLVGFDDMNVFITHVMCASDALVKDHPERVKRFVAAWFDTVKWMSSHKEQTIRLVEPATRLAPALAARVYDIEMPAMSTDGRFDQKALAATMLSFVELGLLASVPNEKQLYTEKFLP